MMRMAASGSPEQRCAGHRTSIMRTEAGETTFALLLRRHRQAARLTQQELAERAGLSERAVNDLERGARQRPRRDTVALLAAALGLVAPERAVFEAAARRSAHTAVELPTPRPADADPLVGRARDLAALDRYLGGDGSPLLLFSGEPGIGKSRLLREAAVRAAGHDLRVLAGGCQRRGGQEPFAPLLDALEGHIRRRAPAQLRADLQGCAWLVRVLPELADGPIEPLPSWTPAPEQERRLITRAVARFLANVAGSAGTLLILDDLQWARADALDLLAALVRSTPEPRLLVLGAYRNTEVGAQDPLAVVLADLAHAGLAAQRTVPPLTLRETEELLDLLLERGERRRDVQQTDVARRTGGVPFYVVSYAQELRRVEMEEVERKAVPWSVAQSIRQRVAALPAPVRTALEVAAVAGRVVEPVVLLAIMHHSEQEVLGALELASRAGLLAEDTHAYLFAHDLIREVVEADVGAARRQALHREVAGVLEQRPGELPVERLAYHYTAADLPAQAIPYWQRAGERAIARSAYVDAIAHLSSGLELLATLPDTPERTIQELALQVGLAGALKIARGWASPEAGRAYTRALELCRQVGDTPRLFMVLYGLWEHYEVRAELSMTREVADQLLVLAETAGEPEHLLHAHHAQGETLFLLGDHAAAVSHFEQVIALYNPEQHRALAIEGGGYDFGVAARVFSGYPLWPLGYADQARRRIEEGLAMACAMSHPFSEVFALGIGGQIHQFRREVQATQELAEAAIALATQLSNPFFLGYGSMLRGWALTEQGRGEEALAQMRQTLGDWRAGGTEILRPGFLALLAEVYGREGRPEEGLAALAEALAAVETTGERWWEPELHRLQGALTLLRPEPDEAIAETCFRRALDVARRQQAKSLELRAMMSLGRLWQAQDRAEQTRRRTAEAYRMLAELYGWFTEGFDTPDLQQAQLLIQELT
jgi:predicted ATPase/DNA-binding XRE family transcriptional regulator